MPLVYYRDRASDIEMREIMNLNERASRHLYQAAGTGCHVAVVSMERQVAEEIPSGDCPGLSNHLPAVLPYSAHEGTHTYNEWVYPDFIKTAS